MATIKRIAVGVGVGLLLAAAIAGYVVCRADHGDDAGVDLRPVVASRNAPAGTVAAPVVEPTPVLKRLKPGYKPTAADTALAGLPPGSSVVHVDPHDQPVDIVLPPQGGVFIPEGTTGVVVYHKPPSLVAFELRPAPFAYGGTDVGAGAALHVVRMGPVHAGPGATWGRNDGPSAGLAAAWNPWRNVDVGGYVGKRIQGDGYAGGVTVGLGIQK